MPIGTDFEIQNDKDIRYIGAAHGAAGAGYYTVLEFHRWLNDLADDAAGTPDDFMDITRDTPSDKSFDTIINLINGYNIDETAAEHLYSGSIIQNGGDDIWDGLQVIANQGMDLQIVQNGAVVSTDFWNYNVKGSHTGSANASVLSDSGASWSTDQWVGYYIKNITDNSWGVITANTATTITATLYGGTDNDWDTSDNYSIVQGLNNNVASGYSHQFMFKVRTAGADVDGRRIIGQTRVWGKTYSEFRIGTGTSRGNNVLALQYVDDPNNITPWSSMIGAPFTSISLHTAGYVGIDVDNDTIDEYFYSEWDKGSASINQFYEYQKYLTHYSTTTTLYGFAGRLVRGVTHEIVIDNPSGTFSAQEEVTWSGGSGRLLAINSPTAGTKMWIQLITGIAPTDGQTITGTTSSATADVNVTVTSRAISTPYLGSSTGSALSGAYGFGVEALDLSSNDKLIDLNNNTFTPPNFVTFTVNGLVATEDTVLVAPLGYRFNYDAELSGPFTVGETLTFTSPAGTAKLVYLRDLGTTGEMIISEPITGSVPTDNSTISGGTSGATANVNGNPVNSVNLGQLNINGALTGAAVTSVVISGSIPSDTPATGTIRIERSNGVYSKHAYTSWSGSTFTIGSTDFSTNNAANGANVYISYIDKVATSTSETFTSIFFANRNLFIRARDGGITPIKTFETSSTLTSAGGSTTVIRTSDE